MKGTSSIYSDARMAHLVLIELFSVKSSGSIKLFCEPKY